MIIDFKNSKRAKKRRNKRYCKEFQLDHQVEVAESEKLALATEKLFFCPHCGCEDVQVDFISDKEDYLCECPNCDTLWTYSKEEFAKATRKQDRILAKAKTWYLWHYGGKITRFKIVMDSILDVLFGLAFVLLLVLGGLSMAGVV